MGPAATEDNEKDGQQAELFFCFSGCPYRTTNDAMVSQREAVLSWGFIYHYGHMEGQGKSGLKRAVLFYQGAVSMLEQCTDHLLVFCWRSVMIQVKMRLVMKTMVMIARKIIIIIIVIERFRNLKAPYNLKKKHTVHKYP